MLTTVFKGLISGLLMILIIHVSFCTVLLLDKLDTAAHLMMFVEVIVFVFVFLINILIGGSNK